MLLTTRKRFVSRPAASNSGKYFWFCLIVRIRHSAARRGTRRRTCRRSTLGLSTSAVTSSSSAVVIGLAARARRRRASPRPRSCRAIALAALAEAGDHPALVLELRARSRRRRASAMSRAPWKRWPCVMRPACRPSTRTGTTSAPCSATRPCAGRTNCTRGPAVGELVAHDLRDRQRARSPRRARAAAPPASVRPVGDAVGRRASRPCRRSRARAARRSMSPSWRAASFFSSAGVGLAVARRARPRPASASPRRRCRGATPRARRRSAPRAGAAWRRRAPRERSPSSPALAQPRRDALRERLARAASAPCGGSSSTKSSTSSGARYHAPFRGEHREAEALARLVVALRHRARQVADAADVGRRAR